MYVFPLSLSLQGNTHAQYLMDVVRMLTSVDAHVPRSTTNVSSHGQVLALVGLWQGIAKNRSGSHTRVDLGDLRGNVRYLASVPELSTSVHVMYTLKRNFKNSGENYLELPYPCVYSTKGFNSTHKS